MKFLFKHKSEEEDGDNDDVIKEKIETDIYRENNHIYF